MACHWLVIMVLKNPYLPHLIFSSPEPDEGEAYRMVGHLHPSVFHLSSVSTFDQLYLHNLQTDLNHFSSKSCLWWGIEDISFFADIHWEPWLLWQPQDAFNLQWENACHHHYPMQFWLDVPETCSGLGWKFGQDWKLKKPFFDFVISVTHSVLIGCSWNLQIRWT